MDIVSCQKEIAKCESKVGGFNRIHASQLANLFVPKDLTPASSGTVGQCETTFGRMNIHFHSLFRSKIRSIMAQ